MLDVLHSVLAAVAVGLSAFGLGRPMVRWLVPAPCDALAVTVWSLVLGLLAAGFVWLLAGWVGWAGLAVAATLVLAGWLWGAVELACAASDVVAMLRRGVQIGKGLGRSLRGPAGRPFADRLLTDRLLAAPRLLAGHPESATGELPPPGGRWLIALAVLVLGATLVGALAPPISPEALSRSLKTPKQILLSGRLVSGGSESTGVNLLHCWFAWALALDGPVAAKVVHWGLGVLLALAAVLLARPVLGARAAWAAGALALICPGVEQQMSLIPAEDLATALFGTLALVSALRAWDAPRSGWAVLAGAMLGGAVILRLSAVALAAAIAIVWVFQAGTRPNDRRDLLRSAVVAAMTMLGFVVPWLASVWPLARCAPQQSLASALIHLGPVAWLAPVAGLVGHRLPGLGVIVGTSGIYAIGASLIPLGERWWSPLVAPLSVAAVWGWSEMRNSPRWPRRVTSAAIAALAIVATIPCFDVAADALPVAAGWQTREDYLAAREPSYRAASLFNRIRGPGDRLICQTARTFYFDGSAVRLADAGEEIAAVDPAAAPAALLHHARALGYSYVLADEAIESASTPAPPSDGAGNAGGLIASWAAADQAIGEVIPILEYRFADDKGRPVRYSLLRIRQHH